MAKDVSVAELFIVNIVTNILDLAILAVRAKLQSVLWWRRQVDQQVSNRLFFTQIYF